MEELIEKLNALYESDAKCEVGDEGYLLYFSDEDDRVRDVEELCCELLICNTGCNWENIRILKENGYWVYAGERDSFGWLTGCIQKKYQNTVLVFG